MTLAVILLNISFILFSVATPQTAPQAGKPADASATQDQGNTQQQNPTAAQPSAAESKPGQTPSATSQHKKPRPQPKKQVPAPNCTSPAAAPSDPTGSAPSTKTAADPPAKGGTTAPSQAAGVPTNCPPPKVIVQQGSTAEPSIQLAGGDAGSHERDATNQMLAFADANLKKIGGAQMTSDQQDIVTQIRQFMDQSKKATRAGDLEQARTLAWKAQTLSAELVNPPK
jgi:hypothetical protein